MKIWIDCGGTAEDLAAIRAAGKHLEISGCSSVAGRRSAKEAAEAVRSLGLPCVEGSGFPLVREPVGPVSAPAEENVTDAIYEAFRRNPGMTFLVLGPLTNLARALIAHPQLSSLVGQVLVAGGTHGGGNVSPRVEFHIWADPHAAHLVLNSGVPVSLLTLDACRQVQGDENGLRQSMAAVAALVDPELFAFREYRVDVELQSGLCLGQTVIDFTGVSHKAPNARVALEGDAPAYQKLRTRLLQDLAEK